MNDDAKREYCAGCWCELTHSNTSCDGQIYCDDCDEGYPLVAGDEAPVDVVHVDRPIV